MQVVVDIHLAVAFLAALCALVFSWSPTGRRVVNAVVALQVIVGLVLAGVLGASHTPLPPTVWLHLIIALAIMACYGAAMRAGKQEGGSTRALLLSIAGLVLILINIALGMHVARLV